MKGRHSLLTLLAAGFLGTALPAEEVTFKASPDVKLGDRKVPMDVALRLKDVSASRISVESVIDLRRAQKVLVDELIGKVFVDVCGAQITVIEFVARTDDVALTLGGKIKAQLFRCKGPIGGERERMEEVFAARLTIGASASAEFRDNCLYFRLLDLTLAPDRLSETEEVKETIEQIKGIVFNATDAILEKYPVCPELPRELSSLTPTYDAGGTRELGDGGIGIFFKGSVDASTETIIDILQVLQSKGVLPPPPK